MDILKDILFVLCVLCTPIFAIFCAEKLVDLDIKYEKKAEEKAALLKRKEMLLYEYEKWREEKESQLMEQCDLLEKEDEHAICNIN